MALLALTGPVGVGGANRPDDVRRVKARLIALGFDWLAADAKVDDETVRTIRLFQSIIAGLHTVRGDGRVDIGGKTQRWLESDMAPRWHVMPAGSAAAGFRNIEIADIGDTHDFGTDWLAAMVRDGGADYRDTYLAGRNPVPALLTINDASLPRGGDTKDHKGHETGLACDLRLPRLDGTAPGQTTVSSGNYDRDSMRAMLLSVRRQPLVTAVFLNDQTLIAEGLCAWQAKHDDHAHVQIGVPEIE